MQAMAAEPTVSWREYVDTRFAAQKEALAIKDSGDREALKLAREIQTYKDEKANELREQIGRERGLYATKDDLKGAVEKLEVALGPLLTYVASQQGRSTGMDKSWAILISVIVAAASIFGIVFALTRHA